MYMYVSCHLDMSSDGNYRWYEGAALQQQQ